jgi:hypothetical protein
MKIKQKTDWARLYYCLEIKQADLCIGSQAVAGLGLAPCLCCAQPSYQSRPKCTQEPNKKCPLSKCTIKLQVSVYIRNVQKWTCIQKMKICKIMKLYYTRRPFYRVNICYIALVVGVSKIISIQPTTSSWESSIISFKWKFNQFHWDMRKMARIRLKERSLGRSPSSLASRPASFAGNLTR